jgi:hypothetical protein
MATQLKTIPAEVVDYLSLHHVITLGTGSFTGIPHADTVVYTNDDARLLFFATEGSNLARNIDDSRYVSFTIDDYTTDWRKVRELQGVGRGARADEFDTQIALMLWHDKFRGAEPPTHDLLYSLTPMEMHFVDYDYATVTREVAPDVTTRTYQMNGADQQPAHGAVSTSLDQLSYAAGQVIFRPGDPAGQYFVVIDGEVEIRGEGFGADQTVVRVGPGQMFGDHAAMRGQRGAFTAHAVSDTHLLAVERDTMRDLLLPHDD